MFALSNSAQPKHNETHNCAVKCCQVQAGRQTLRSTHWSPWPMAMDQNSLSQKQDLKSVTLREILFVVWFKPETTVDYDRLWSWSQNVPTLWECSHWTETWLQPELSIALSDLLETFWDPGATLCIWWLLEVWSTLCRLQYYIAWLVVALPIG